MARYVILLHELSPDQQLAGGRGTHWDLMLERGDVLWTWALPVEPLPDSQMTAEQLPNHRLAYLDYEGPVSGNRGQVSQWDAGQYEILSESADALTVRLTGTRGVVVAVLSREEPTGSEADTHFWSVSFSRAPIRG